MNVMLVVILLLIGIVFIVRGGDYFVDAASWTAEVSGIPKLIIGATIVSLATTLPEVLVSLMAAGKGKVDMSIGNAVGSVTANIGLIMALSLICIPFVIRRKDYLCKVILLLSAAVLIVASGLRGQMDPVIAAAMFVIFVVFFWENVAQARRAMKEKGEKAEVQKRRVIGRREVAVNIVKFVVGTVGIVWGADLLVDNGSELARLAGISERVIGITIIAIGTSLPELITTITAILKRQSSLSVGNIIGANIIDLTLILPLCALVSGKPLPITASFALFDLPACLLVSCIALLPAMIFKKFQRWQGVFLLVVYGGYLLVSCTA